MATAHDGYIELNGYSATIYVNQGYAPAVDQVGGWWAFVKFEREVKFSDKRTSIPAFRHPVPGAFESPDAAVEAAYDYARRTIEIGDVGL